MTTFEIGHRVKMNSIGVETFPKRKGVIGTVKPSRGKDGIVSVLWDGFSTAERLSTHFLYRAKERRKETEVDRADKLAVQIVSLVSDAVDMNGELGAYEGIEAARKVREMILKAFG